MQPPTTATVIDKKIGWMFGGPWMFPLESHNHAICPSVHNRDICVLPIKHLQIYVDFCNGSSAVQKTKRLFLSLTLDHTHEQVNAVVKGGRGAAGLSENPTALRRWMVPSSELALMVEEFNEIILTSESQTCKYFCCQPGVLFRRAGHSIQRG